MNYFSNCLWQLRNLCVGLKAVDDTLKKPSSLALVSVTQTHFTKLPRGRWFL